MEHRFVGLPKKGQTYLYREEGSKLKKAKQVLWGDWLCIDPTKGKKIKGKDYLAVIWGPKSDDPQTYYILEEHTDKKRPMELIFLDVGQGDGCVLITPERNQNERIMIIDAGKGDNMNNFLESRFKTYRNKFQFDAAILTHPDNDHYLGFNNIFANKKIGFNNVYHNGLNERPVSGSWDKLGKPYENKTTGKKYVKELVETKKRLEELYSSKEKIGDFQYPGVMNKALNNENIKGYKMLSVHKKHSTQAGGRSYMKGFAPKNKRAYTIEVLGPVPEEINKKLMLRRLSSYGETKNGHSILLRLHYGNFKIFFGGDLNIPAEKYLLQYYTDKEKWPKSGSAKSSEKVTDEFIRAVDPACFIISSGDEEGHVHPRPDLLGRLGKLGRSSSPVILSTELQRSTRESEDQKVIDRLKKNAKKFRTIKDEELADHAKSVEKDIDRLGRTNVSVFGSIYIKTDGERLIAAFKNEADSETKKWFYFEYHLNDKGELVLKS